MFCARCGKPVSSEERFCAACGEPVATVPGGAGPSQPLPPRQSSGTPSTSAIPSLRKRRSPGETLEIAYLGALRIFILLIASFALLAAIGVAVVAAMGFLRPPEKPREVASSPTPSLASYVAEAAAKRSRSSPPINAATEASKTPGPVGSGSRDGKEELRRQLLEFGNEVYGLYLKEEIIDKIVAFVASVESELPQAEKGQYLSSAKALATELVATIPEQRVLFEQSKTGENEKLINPGQLFLWHAERFRAAARERSQAAEEANATNSKRKANAQVQLNIAGGLLGTFLGLALLLIAVRIERNLRPLSVLSEAAPWTSSMPAPRAAEAAERVPFSDIVR